MPPNDRPAKNHLLALGSAAVLAVYGAGFVRTQAAADRFEGESRRRRPAAPVAAASRPVDVSIPEPVVAPAIPEQAAPKAEVAKAKTDTAKVIAVAETPKPKITTAAPVAVDTAAKAPADTTPKFADYKDGVYTGWGTSRHGDIESRIEIRNGRIISASIAQCLTMYSVYWIAALPPQVVKRQSPEVDFISGATESTNAFYYGVLEALKKAK